MMYRNKKLLELANECPICCACSAANTGNVVAAHSNQLKDGKGRGIKAHDFRVAFICDRCHYELDQAPTMSKEERHAFWEEAHRNTIAYLFLSGHIKIV